jgi:hypothetical protein
MPVHFDRRNAWRTRSGIAGKREYVSTIPQKVQGTKVSIDLEGLCSVMETVTLPPNHQWWFVICGSYHQSTLLEVGAVRISCRKLFTAQRAQTFEKRVAASKSCLPYGDGLTMPTREVEFLTFLLPPRYYGSGRRRFLGIIACRGIQS